MAKSKVMGEKSRKKMKFLDPIINSIYLRGKDSMFVRVWGPLGGSFVSFKAENALAHGPKLL